MSPLVDCHAHLDMLPDVAAAVSNARKAGVGGILAVGIDVDSSRKAVACAHDFTEVLASVGIHPHGAAHATDDDFDIISSLAADNRVVAIGETGLDYYRDRAPRHIQQEVFRRHIALARDTELPLIVHSRDSAEATMELLAREAAGITIILHCFALVDYVEECARRGYFMSVAGNVSYKNAATLREAVTLIPNELILTETDSPYLTPAPYRGKTNCPAYIAEVTASVAALRGTTATRLAAVVFANFRRAFSLDPSGSRMSSSSSP